MAGKFEIQITDINLKADLNPERPHGGLNNERRFSRPAESGGGGGVGFARTFSFLLLLQQSEGILRFGIFLASYFL